MKNLAVSSPPGITVYHDQLRGLILELVPARTNVSIENLLKLELQY